MTQKGSKYPVRPLASYPAAWHEAVRQAALAIASEGPQDWHRIGSAKGLGGVKNRLMRLRSFRKALEQAGANYPRPCGWWLSQGWTLGFRQRALPGSCYAIDFCWKMGDEGAKKAVQDAFGKLPWG